MNTDQLNSIIRTVMKIASGLLIAHGLQGTADMINSADVTGSILLIVSLLWSHFNHGSDTNGGNAAVKLLLALALPAFLLTGCKSLDAGADPLVVRTEQTQTMATAALDTFLKIDNQNRLLIATNLPSVHAFAEWLRVKTPSADGTTNVTARWVSLLQSTESAKLAYKQNRSPDNSTKLNAALTALDVASKQAQSQLIQVQNLNQK